MSSILNIQDLRVKVGEREVLKGVDLTVKEGSVYVLFGPNGSGKTTLMNSLIGYPGYSVKGSIMFEGKEITRLDIDRRANMGLNISFQLAPQIKGVTLRNMVNICLKREAEAELQEPELELIKRFKLSDLLDRDINVGFSGGERKRADILQLLLLKPKFLLLDEPDSGVDVESLRVIAREIEYYIRSNNASALIITHQGQVLEHITTKLACVLADGKIHCYQDPLRILEEIKAKGYSECISCQKRISNLNNKVK